MTTIEILEPKLSRTERDDLERALALIERDSLAAKLTGALGGNIGWIGRRLPSGAKRMVAMATEHALKSALKVAVSTLRPAARRQRKSTDRWHKAAAAASGAIGGAFGLMALAIELPISTTILLRSIAEIARAEGEDLSTPEAMLACIEVFALGDEPGGAVAEGGYFAARAAIAEAVNESARFLLRSGLSGETAPIVVRLVTQLASRFGVAVSEKVAAQAVPIVGAFGGAAINAAFADHFQNVARGHFIIRRLERRCGAEAVHEEYQRLKMTRVGGN
jgi:hypothetical protein